MRIKNTDEIRQFFNTYISTCCSILRWTNFTAKLETVDEDDVHQLVTGGEHLITLGQRLERYLKNDGVPKVYVDDFGREVTFEQQFVKELTKRKEENKTAKENTDERA